MIQILFFGATADVAGSRRLEMDVADGTAAAAVFDLVIKAHPRLAAHKLLYSVNQQFAAGDELLNDGDELAVFTAVSGG